MRTIVSFPALERVVELILTLRLVMVKGKGDVVQLTGDFVRLARRLVKKLKRHNLEDDQVNCRRIETQMAEVKKILSYEGNADDITEKGTFGYSRDALYILTVIQ